MIGGAVEWGDSESLLVLEKEERGALFRLARGLVVAASSETCAELLARFARGRLHATISGDELSDGARKILRDAQGAMPWAGPLRIRATVDEANFVIVARGAKASPGSARSGDPPLTITGIDGARLGLYLLEGIARHHGGAATRRSDGDRGVTLRVVLPLELEIIESAAPIDSARRPPRGTRVLLVEDDEVTRDATRALLEHSGCVVVEAATGAEAIAAFRPAGFDLVLSDLEMPDRDGWAVARAIKQLSPSTPVALITGWTLALDPADALRRGVDVVVRKPVAPLDLLARLADLLRVARR